MKGFIEVTVNERIGHSEEMRYGDVKKLIAVSSISRVDGSCISMDLAQQSIYAQESYDEIKQKLTEAQTQ